MTTDLLRKADIRPHPHIGLSTMSYLLAGAMTHRDSLGSEIVLHPGEVNWMTAGKGIVHSERFDNPGEPPSGELELIQAWVALPNGKEEIAPGFEHYSKEALPVFEQDGVWGRVILGSAYGLTSGVTVHSPIFYIHAVMQAKATLALPEAYSGRAVYIVHGRIAAEGNHYSPGQMLVFTPGGQAVVRAEELSILMLLGGEPVGERFIWWNFVSSTEERIAQARDDWKNGRFVLPPNDNKEFTPLPDN